METRLVFNTFVVDVYFFSRFHLSYEKTKIKGITYRIQKTYLFFYQTLKILSYSVLDKKRNSFSSSQFS